MRLQDPKPAVDFGFTGPDLFDFAAISWISGDSKLLVGEYILTTSISSNMKSMGHSDVFEISKVLGHSLIDRICK